MRSMPTSMQQKLASRIQAGDTALSASLWVGRPTTPLTDKRFLETQNVIAPKNVSRLSMAVCHPRLMRGATDVYIAYIEDGIVKILRSAYFDTMSKHTWTKVNFAEEAEDVSICFNGSMPKVPSGQIEFQTEQNPWIFTVLNGALYGQRLGEEKIMLAEKNCTAVSAVRAMWSSSGGFDFGLIVFFLLSGQIYYRQLIDGEWMDAEVVSAGPQGVIYEDLSAFRTWDYRVGLQLKTTDGVFYELFTQFMGIGKQMTEHIELRDISVKNKFQQVTYYNVSNGKEHVNINNVSVNSLLQVATPPVLTSVYNIEDADGDWGTTVVVEFDVNVDGDSVLQNLGAFVLIDENENEFVPYEIAFDNESKRSATFRFVNINLAFGVCRFVYTPGTIKSVVNTAMPQQEFEFTPQNLEVPDVDPPVPVSARNVNADGTLVELEFSEALIFGVDGSEANFTVTSPEYKFVPGGEIEQNVKPVVNVKKYQEVETAVDISSGVSTNVTYEKGKLKLKKQGGV